MGQVVCNEYIERDTYFIMKTNRHNVKIDKEDIYRCQRYKWRMCGDNGYVFAMINNKKTYLQSFILNTNATVDHINHNIYDNRKENLRISNKSQNMMNSILSKRNTSGVKGVSFDITRNKWMASIYKDGKNYNIGRYQDFHQAVRARFKKEIELFEHNSIYYNQDSDSYLLEYVYNGQIFTIKSPDGNTDRGGHGSTGTN